MNMKNSWSSENWAVFMVIIPILHVPSDLFIVMMIGKDFRVQIWDSFVVLPNFPTAVHHDRRVFEIYHKNLRTLIWTECSKYGSFNQTFLDSQSVSSVLSYTNLCSDNHNHNHNQNQQIDSNKTLSKHSTKVSLLTLFSVNTLFNRCIITSLPPVLEASKLTSIFYLCSQKKIRKKVINKTVRH